MGAGQGPTADEWGGKASVRRRWWVALAAAAAAGAPEPEPLRAGGETASSCSSERAARHSPLRCLPSRWRGSYRGAAAGRAVRHRIVFFWSPNSR